MSDQASLQETPRDRWAENEANVIRLVDVLADSTQHRDLRHRAKLELEASLGEPGVNARVLLKYSERITDERLKAALTHLVKAFEHLGSAAAPPDTHDTSTAAHEAQKLISQHLQKAAFLDLREFGLPSIGEMIEELGQEGQV